MKASDGKLTAAQRRALAKLTTEWQSVRRINVQPRILDQLVGLFLVQREVLTDSEGLMWWHYRLRPDKEQPLTEDEFLLLVQAVQISGPFLGNKLDALDALRRVEGANDAYKALLPRLEAMETALRHSSLAYAGLSEKLEAMEREREALMPALRFAFHIYYEMPGYAEEFGLSDSVVAALRAACEQKGEGNG